LVWVADGTGVDEKKGLDESHSGIDFAFSFVSRQLQVGCSIQEVAESPSDVFGSLNDAGTKIIV
jgi:hypothetical protein